MRAMSDLEFRKRKMTMVERYKNLGLGEALRRAYDYVPACHELSFILRGAYSNLPKNLQTLVFQDTLAAFRLLPDAQTSSRMSAVNLVLQAAEVALPKQKRASAISELKHAVVAHKRRCKAQQDEGSVQLPEDVLGHIFSFLDLRSLVAVGLVCRGWNSVASDNILWQSQYFLLFGNNEICYTSKGQLSKALQDESNVVLCQIKEGQDPVTNYRWREAFKWRYIGDSSWRFMLKRGYCGHCKSIIWLNTLTRANSHPCSKLESQPLKIKPIPSHKVVKYLLGETTSTISSDSDDSDADGSSPFEQGLPKLWAYPSI